MNNRGTGEALMFFAFMFLILIIAAGIVFGVSSFYGKGYEFRHVEAQLLRDNVLGCFSNNDFFEQGFDFYATCKINEGVIGSDKYLIYIRNLKDEGVFSIGVADYLNQCSFRGAEGNDDFPKCANGTFTKGNDNFYYVFGSNQRGGGVLT